MMDFELLFVRIALLSLGCFLYDDWGDWIGGEGLYYLEKYNIEEVVIVEILGFQ